MRSLILLSILLVCIIAQQQNTRNPELASLYNIEYLKEGDGVHFPSKGQEISMHYTGTFQDGRVFDSSVNRGQPFNVRAGVGQVIKCWDELVVAMSVGEKIKVTCPPEKAYGSRGAGSVIPPNTPIQFEMELLDIVGQEL